MDRRDVLKRLLYPKCKTAVEFKFDTLMVNPLLTYISPQDIYQLNKIATSIKYSSKPKEKYAMIDNILVPRGFKKMASGTNRVVYRFLEDYRIVLKVAIDKVGLSDNGNEFRNQHLLKPFVTKCFEVSPCGTVGIFERVVPITSREEFINISEDIFDLINNLIGKYVLEDIGEKYYMNYGLREGFGPVLLDYPYVFELDGRKLFCNVPEPMSPLGYCGGEIDYDLGYNDLICTKCGKRYLATELKSDEKSDKPKIIIKGDDIIMKCVLKRGNEVVSELNSKAPVTTNTIKSKREFDNLKVRLSRDAVEDEKSEYKPNITTHDEVTLKVELRGKRKSENIDLKAVKKEQILERNTPSISVSLKPDEPVQVKEETFKVKLSTSPEEQVEIVEECVEPEAVEETTPVEEESEIESMEEIPEEEVESITEVMEEVLSKSENEVVYSEDTGCSIGEILAGKLNNFKGNENYKTNDIVSPVEEHYSKPVENKSTNEEEPEYTSDDYNKKNWCVERNISEENVEENENMEERVEEVVEQEVEIPELIIHPRTETEESEAEEDSEEVDNIDLY